MIICIIFVGIRVVPLQTSLEEARQLERIDFGDVSGFDCPSYKD